METIGFIGQGWIGKHYADDFEKRGFSVVRFAKEAPYEKNQAKIADCDVVFIAVPTPTTPEGFDDSIVRSVVGLVGKGKIAVIKSTILPGTTESIQKQYPDIFVLHSPEFLSESTAAHDAAHPQRNIVGVPVWNDVYVKKAHAVLNVLPNSPYQKVCTAKEAELIKYTRNGLGYVRVVFTNLLYDLATKMGADWNVLREAISADPDNGPAYANPVHKSGRGAGGHCFIKDFHSLSEFYKEQLQDERGNTVFESLEQKNNELLVKTGKDLDLLRGVIGEEGINAVK